MIIWGTRGLTRKGKVGRFYCPHCDGERDYRTVKVQRFFTLYFIPLIPMDVVYEGVRCETCASEFKLAVLGYDPRAERAAIQQEVNRGLVEILLTFSALSGRSDPAHFEAIRGHLDAIGCQDFSADQIAALAGQGRMDMAHTAERIGPKMTATGHEALVKGALLTAAPDGPPDAGTEQRLADLARALGMSEIHLRGVIASHAPAIA
jgi:hypothetical protein